MQDNRIEASVKRTMKYVSVHGTVVLIALGVLVGYLGGWYVQERPDMTGAAIVVAVVFGFMLRVPIRMWMTWVQAAPTEKLIASITKEIGEANKPKKKDKDSFDQSDFDEATRVLLIKMVRKARKDGAHIVSGQQFYTTVLKSIR